MVGKTQNAHRPDGLTLFLGDAVVDARPNLTSSHWPAARPPIAEWPRLQRPQAPLHDVPGDEASLLSSGLEP